MPLLDVHGLGCFYGSRRVLEDVHLRVEPGEGLAVVGPNGAGKSTLLRLLAGLRRPEEGTITFFADGAASSHRRDRRSRIGYLGHRLLLYPDLTGRENLRFHAALHGLARSGARVAQWLDRFGLAEAADRPLRQYSRGMGQRLALARALLHEPELLFLDEPFSGLDLGGVRLLRGILREHLEEGGACLLATHDLDRARDCCHRALVLARKGTGREVGVEALAESDLHGAHTAQEPVEEGRT